MPLSRVMKETCRAKGVAKIADPLLNTAPAAKGKATKQYNQTGSKDAVGPHFRQDKVGTSGNLKLI